MPVAHTCNLSYSGGRDQKNCSSKKPAWANSSVRPYLEKPFTKNRAGGVAQGEGPKFKAPVLQKKAVKSKEFFHSFFHSFIILFHSSFVLGIALYTK
jgi:hypothetical protein